MVQRLLIIRGGAIGDFILSLPAIGALRQAFSQTYMEVVGHPRRAILAHHPAYADRVTDPDALELYRLFSRQSRVSERLAGYLRSFDVIFAYLPQAFPWVATHLQTYASGHVVTWPPQPAAGWHMTEHLLQPVVDFRPQRYDPTPRVYLTADAYDAAEHFWRSAQLPAEGVIAVHPGSGGEHKVWPLNGWQRVLRWMARQGIPCILLCGPADHDRVAQLQRDPDLPPWPCVRDMPLLHLAAIMARCQVMIGHDSGMTHLAAAAGATTLALFGPTDPLTWGPRSPRACVLQPQHIGPLRLDNLPPEVVIRTLAALWTGTFSFMPSRVECTIYRVSD